MAYTHAATCLRLQTGGFSLLQQISAVAADFTVAMFKGQCANDLGIAGDTADRFETLSVKFLAVPEQLVLLANGLN